MRRGKVVQLLLVVHPGRGLHLGSSLVHILKPGSGNCQLCQLCQLGTDRNKFSKPLLLFFITEHQVGLHPFVNANHIPAHGGDGGGDGGDGWWW